MHERLDDTSDCSPQVVWNALNDNRMVSRVSLAPSLQYQIIRERHEKGLDIPYVPEAARVIVKMA
jgi:hypothetical protein